MILYVLVCQNVGSLKFYSCVVQSSDEVEAYSKNHHVIDVHQIEIRLEVD